MRSKNPNGPLLDKIIAITKPTITEGILMDVYINLEKSLFPLKSFIPKYTPIGIVTQEDIIVDVKETNTDSITILYTALSRLIKSLNASINPCDI